MMANQAKIVVVSIVLLTAVLHAAPDYSGATKGSVMLGGTFSVRNTAGAPSDWVSNFAEANPYALYFVTQGLGLGGGLNFGLWEHDGLLTEFGLGPKVEYYFGQSQARSHPYFGLGICFRSRGAVGRSWSGAGIDGSVGIAHMVDDRVATLLRVGYLWEVLAQADRVRADGVFSISFGITGWVGGH